MWWYIAEFSIYTGNLRQIAYAVCNGTLESNFYAEVRTEEYRYYLR